MPEPNGVRPTMFGGGKFAPSLAHPKQNCWQNKRIFASDSLTDI